MLAVVAADHILITVALVAAVAVMVVVLAPIPMGRDLQVQPILVVAVAAQQTIMEAMLLAELEALVL